MKMSEMVSTSPIGVEKSVRPEEIRALTSCKAGKHVPIAFAPLLREDRVSRGSLRLSFDMAETIHPLMNAVNVTAYVHFIPFFAFERFATNGMDAFNRSYQREGEPHNGTPIEFFHMENFDRTAEFWRTLGVHWPDGVAINSAPLEAYNTLVNWRREVRSDKLPLRGLYNTALAPAYWKNTATAHIVPDFDQAAMDGEVELQWTTPKLGLSGMGRSGGSSTPETDVAVQERTGSTTYDYAMQMGDPQLYVRTKSGGAPDVFAELEEAGVKLSLANIELAKQTAAFAKLRKQFQGIDDEHIIDLLMEGIRVPDEALKQPILLDKASTIFGYSERHAMDGPNMETSVTTGSTSLDLRFRTPAMNTGGIILVTCEIVPEQLMERFYDQFLGTTNPDELPNFLRDYLDPEKVAVVPNRYVDVEHSAPNATFGYAPLNHEWRRSMTRIGGKYYRKLDDSFVEDRQRFWAVEQIDPTLNEDFYWVRDLPHSVFLDSVSDPFEIMALGKMNIVGNTVFGKGLQEDTDDYNKIMDQVDTDRIDQEAT